MLIHSPVGGKGIYSQAFMIECGDVNGVFGLVIITGSLFSRFPASVVKRSLFQEEYYYDANSV